VAKKKTAIKKREKTEPQKTYLVALVATALVVLTLFAYWRVLGNGFVEYDDGTYVFANAHIQQGITAASIKWAFNVGYAGNWHPLTWMSYMIDYRFFGLEPKGYHLVNLLFHLANVLLLLLVLKRMTSRLGSTQAGSLWRSTFVAALFAVHPLHVESVAWIAERKDVLSTFFWLLTMGAYALYSEKPGIRRYLPVLLLYALGLMAKPMLVTLPFVLLLLDYWPLKRNMRWSRLVLEKTPMLAMAIASCVLTVIAQSSKGSISTLEAYTPGTRIAGSLVGYATYMWKMVWPLNLAILYPNPGSDMAVWRIAASATILIAISVLVYVYGRKRRELAVGWLWYLGTLVPVIGLVQVGRQSTADRYTYVPLIGLFIAIVWMIPTRLQTKTIASGFGLAVVSILAIMTWVQVGLWRDSITLFEHTLRCTSDNYVIENSLGIALTREGKFDEAGDHYRASLRTAPDFTQAHNNLGTILVSQGKLNEALYHFRKALEVEPNQAIMHFNVGAILEAQGKIDEAISEYRKCIQYRPDSPNAYYNLGRILERQGKPGEAIEQYRAALEVDPEHQPAAQACERLEGK
jgi:Tfp pilus assembly protein PilF